METDTPPSEPRQTEPGAGSLLRQAREEKGLDITAIAAELHLDLSTVEALEADAAERLPAPIFVRGYIRSYARRVGLDEHRVLAAYRQPAIEEEPVPVRRRRGPATALPLASLLHLLGGLLKKLVLLALLMGVVWLVFLAYEYWQKQTEEPAALTPQTLSLPPAGEPLNGDRDNMMETPPALPQPEPETQPPAVSPVPEVQSAVTAEPPAATPATMELGLTFAADSWMDVRDASGKKLLFGLVKQGASRTLDARPPVKLVIGNAAAVSLTVNGHPYDLSAYNRNNVARLTLTE